MTTIEKVDKDKDIEKQPLLLKDSDVKDSDVKNSDVTNSDVTTIQFGNYFDGESKLKGEHAPCCRGQCLGETLLPCVPGFNCCKEPCTTWRVPPLFWTINYLALIGHFINTILTFVLSFTNEDVVYDLKEISEAWTDEAGTNGCTTGMPANSFDAKVIQAGDSTICVSYSSTTTETLSLFNLIIWFHLLSFVFQLVAMVDWNFPIFCCCSKPADKKDKGVKGLWGSIRGFRCVRERYVDEVQYYGTNMLRMIEYSISATLMQVAIALVLGIDSRFEIRAIAVLTVLVMLLGLIAEQLKNTTWFKTAWFSHLLGWFAMFAVWSLIFGKFTHSVTMSEADGGDGPPDFVFIMIIVIAIMYMAFGLLQLAQLVWITLYGETSMEFNNIIETGYNFMSLTSKTFLGTFLIANVLFAPRVIDQCLPKTNETAWHVLGCNVTTFDATNVSDLGDINPATGFRSCKIKCVEEGETVFPFTVESEENRCDKVDNVTWWASKGCNVTDSNSDARTVSELNASVQEPLWSSCTVTCPEDNGEFVVESVLIPVAAAAGTPVPGDGTIYIGTCEQVDCSTQPTNTNNLGSSVTGNDVTNCCTAPPPPASGTGTCDLIDCSVLEMIEDETTVPMTMTTFWASLGSLFSGDDTITCCHMPNLSSCSPFHGCQGEWGAITGDYDNIGVSANPVYKTFANCCRPMVGGSHPAGWVDCVLSPCDGQVGDPYNRL